VSTPLWKGALALSQVAVVRGAYGFFVGVSSNAQHRKSPWINTETTTRNSILLSSRICRSVACTRGVRVAQPFCFRASKRGQFIYH
jgi:hypothetical protein